MVIATMQWILQPTSLQKFFLQPKLSNHTAVSFMNLQTIKVVRKHDLIISWWIWNVLGISLIWKDVNAIKSIQWNSIILYIFTKFQFLQVLIFMFDAKLRKLLKLTPREKYLIYQYWRYFSGQSLPIVAYIYYCNYFVTFCICRAVFLL